MSLIAKLLWKTPEVEASLKLKNIAVLTDSDNVDCFSCSFVSSSSVNCKHPCTVKHKIVVGMYDCEVYEWLN